jgi:hypothetical protein
MALTLPATSSADIDMHITTFPEVAAELTVSDR